MSAVILKTTLTTSYFLSLVSYFFPNAQIILLRILIMAYFRLSLSALGTVTELKVQSFSFI